MGKCANISPYMRRPLVINDFATAPLWISLYMRKIWFSFLSVHPYIHPHLLCLYHPILCINPNIIYIYPSLLCINASFLCIYHLLLYAFTSSSTSMHWPSSSLPLLDLLFYTFFLLFYAFAILFLASISSFSFSSCTNTPLRCTSNPHFPTFLSGCHAEIKTRDLHCGKQAS